MVGVYTIFYAKEAAKDAKKLKAAFLDQKAKALIDILRANPYQWPPAYEKLQGDLAGLYSRRINRKHRLVYAVEEKSRQIKILSLWSHYERVPEEERKEAETV